MLPRAPLRSLSETKTAITSPKTGVYIIYISLYWVHWEEGKKHELEKLAKMHIDHQRQQAELAQKEGCRSNWEKCHAVFTNPKIYKDWYLRY